MHRLERLRERKYDALLDALASPKPKHLDLDGDDAELAKLFATLQRPPPPRDRSHNHCAEVLGVLGCGASPPLTPLKLEGRPLATPPVIDDRGPDDAEPLIRVPVSPSLRSIATGSSHSCAVEPTGRVRCWGANDQGQLGDGTTKEHGGTSEVARLTDIVSVVAGGDHTCALRRDGRVMCWGGDKSGEIGDGIAGTALTKWDPNPHPVPVPVRHLRAVAIAAGTSHTCALTIRGDVYCWGGNQHGQLGDGTRLASSGPINVTTLRNEPLTAMKALGTGTRHTCAADDTGLFCWGDGRMDDLEKSSPSWPARVLEIVGVHQIAIGDQYTCVARTGDPLFCWGIIPLDPRIPRSYPQVIRVSSTPPSSSFGDPPVSEVSLSEHNSVCVIQHAEVDCWGPKGETLGRAASL